MLVASLILALQLTTEVSGPKRIDATSDATLESTVAAVKADLPEAQRPKFDQAMKLLMGEFVEKLGDDESRDDVLAGWRAILHGKSARDVVTAAEALVRTLIDKHAKEQMRVVSRAVPGASPASGASFACEALLATSIQPERSSEAEFFSITDTSLLKPEAELDKLIDPRRLEAKATLGTDNLAIEIDGNRLKFITGASVEAGQASATTFTIARNDELLLVAFALQEEPLGVTVHSLLLNRENGLAVWTKSRPTFLIDKQPDTQALYLMCK